MSIVSSISDYRVKVERYNYANRLGKLVSCAPNEAQTNLRLEVSGGVVYSVLQKGNSIGGHRSKSIGSEHDTGFAMTLANHVRELIATYKLKAPFAVTLTLFPESVKVKRAVEFGEAKTFTNFANVDYQARTGGIEKGKNLISRALDVSAGGQSNGVAMIVSVDGGCFEAVSSVLPPGARLFRMLGHLSVIDYLFSSPGMLEHFGKDDQVLMVVGVAAVGYYLLRGSRLSDFRVDPRSGNLDGKAFFTNVGSLKHPDGDSEVKKIRIVSLAETTPELATLIDDTLKRYPDTQGIEAADILKLDQQGIGKFAKADQIPVSLAFHKAWKYSPNFFTKEETVNPPMTLKEVGLVTTLFRVRAGVGLILLFICGSWLWGALKSIHSPAWNAKKATEASLQADDNKLVGLRDKARTMVALANSRVDFTNVITAVQVAFPNALANTTSEVFDTTVGNRGKPSYKLKLNGTMMGADADNQIRSFQTRLQDELARRFDGFEVTVTIDDTHPVGDAGSAAGLGFTVSAELERKGA